ncbi:hypothetical protein HL667_07105 [Bradyrhizobium sp. 83012]|uniref:Abortive phage infection protein C-terminal domain-containing protein n=1 Tax=Bradyrhizobium aeschynomenes TaxID=2734909 RepID=A0ABX2C900_9BRAD|nr:AIPR family protein [Bradyrhizobium aeschynomenes]NPU64754.1 hypothetical protein [Bradyrhizobium aeschynomenes]
MTNAERLDQEIESLARELGAQYGRTKDDYYGLAFFQNILQLPRELAIQHNAFGNHDLGVDGYYFDQEQETFRIFQFKNSKNSKLFQPSMLQLLNKGIRSIFEDYSQRPVHQPIIDLARQRVRTAKDEISQVLVDFVFRGDPAEAEQSMALSDLREKIADMVWLTEEFFGERVPINVRFLCFDGIQPNTAVPTKFEIRMTSAAEMVGPEGMKMYLGFAPLLDLHAIYSILGRSFLESNIRFALPADGAVNRALYRTLSSIVLERNVDPRLFAFHHNGITLSSAFVQNSEAGVVVGRPRLLNGAQTVSTFAEFFDRNRHAFKAVEGEGSLSQIYLPCRIVVARTHEDVTEITINNNRQNPVLAWQLHANDQIQLLIEDWFKEDGIPYQRQQRAFSKMSAEEWQEKGYTETRSVELIRLARTYLAVEGELNRLAHIADEFENDANYRKLFGPHRLNFDRRKVVLCYKAGFKANVLVKEIREKGEKYEFVSKGRDLIYGLVCQGLLNDDRIEDLADEYGHNLSTLPGFVDHLCRLASAKVRFLIRDVAEDREFAEFVSEGKYAFLRSSRAFERCMKHAARRHGWKRHFLQSA